jgi:hypothetical protein
MTGVIAEVHRGVAGSNLNGIKLEAMGLDAVRR